LALTLAPLEINNFITSKWSW